MILHLPTNPVYTFLLLLGMHCLGDYALQGDFMAKAKNHRNCVPGVPWWTVLLSHGTIHAMFVGIITNCITLGMCEFVLHSFIDYMKNDEKISYNIDQALHIMCKAVWSTVMYNCMLVGIHLC